MKMKKVILTVIAAGVVAIGIRLFWNDGSIFKSICDTFRSMHFEEEPLSSEEAAAFLSDAAVKRAKDFTSFTDDDGEDKFLIFDFGSKVSGYSIFSSLRQYCTEKGGKQSGGVLIWQDKDSSFTASLSGQVLTISQGVNEVDMLSMQDKILSMQRYIPHTHSIPKDNDMAEAK